MKHIALFIPTLGGGGAERVTIALARGFADLGYRVSLVVANATGSLANEVPLNVTVVDLKVGRVLFAVKQLSTWLRKEKPDILISSQGHANIAAFLSNRLAGTPSRLIVREVSTPSVNLKHLTGWSAWFWRTVTGYVYERADVVVAVSQGVAEDLRAYLARGLPNLRVIYNPVLVDDIASKANEKVEHPWLQSGHSIPVVLAVGRLTEAKNYPLLINAFSLLLKQQRAKLIILGEGEQRPMLEKLISTLGIAKEVSMPGFDSNPFKYMAKASVYVMSSDWEGLPGALIQALYLCGNVVSTDCPSGPREILADGRYGVLVPVNDMNALADAIKLKLEAAGHDKRDSELDSFLAAFGENSSIRQYCSQFNE